MNTNGSPVGVHFIRRYDPKHSEFRAQIIDESCEMKQYYLPLKSFFDVSPERTTAGFDFVEENYSFALRDIILYLDSPSERPFTVEIKSVSLVKDPEIEKTFKDYTIPIFKPVDKI